MLGDISKLKNSELETFLPRMAFGMKDDDIHTAQFVFWVIFFSENLIERIMTSYFGGYVTGAVEGGFTHIAEPKGQKKESIDQICGLVDRIATRPMVDEFMSEMTFSGKINILERRVYRKGEVSDRKKLISFLRDLNSLRNQISHNKFSGLKFRGKDLSLRATKEKLIKDLFRFMGKSDEVKMT